MKNLLTIIILLLTFGVKAQALKITIYNKTGYDVDSLSLQSVYIGYIAKDSSITLLLKNYEIKIEDGIPFFPIADGKVKGLKEAIKDTTTEKSISYGFCGTGSHFIDSGEYSFDLTFLNNTLWWDGHRER